MQLPHTNLLASPLSEGRPLRGQRAEHSSRKWLPPPAGPSDGGCKSGRGVRASTACHNVNTFVGLYQRLLPPFGLSSAQVRGTIGRFARRSSVLHFHALFPGPWLYLASIGCIHAQPYKARTALLSS